MLIDAIEDPARPPRTRLVQPVLAARASHGPAPRRGS